VRADVDEDDGVVLLDRDSKPAAVGDGAMPSREPPTRRAATSTAPLRLSARSMT
jgi:hypothetical protein